MLKEWRREGGCTGNRKHSPLIPCQHRLLLLLHRNLPLHPPFNHGFLSFFCFSSDDGFVSAGPAFAGCTDHVGLGGELEIAIAGWKRKTGGFTM